jgi:hypothetical protein
MLHFGMEGLYNDCTHRFIKECEVGDLLQWSRIPKLFQAMRAQSQMGKVRQVIEEDLPQTETTKKCLC